MWELKKVIFKRENGKKWYKTETLHISNLSNMLNCVKILLKVSFQKNKQNDRTWNVSEENFKIQKQIFLFLVII